MKKFMLLPFLAAFLLAAPTNGQEEKNQPPLWIQALSDPDVNFYEANKNYESYWETRAKVKGSGWKKFERWRYITAPRVDATGNRPGDLQKFRAARATQKRSKSKELGQWASLGPLQLPGTSTGQPNGMGRLNAVAFDPYDPNRLFVGAPSGGLWETNDLGENWHSVTDNLPTLGVSAILIHPTHPDTMYMGTGDRDAGDAPGIGVMKSDDGGQNWYLHNNGMGEETVGMMRFHPDNPQIILAATSNGMYRTTNAGENWTKTSTTAHFKDLELHPSNPDIAYATADGDVYRSDDNGQAWQQISGQFASNSRAVIGVSAHQPDWVYVLLSDNNGFVGLYKSTDSGQTFDKKSDSPNILGYDQYGGDNNSQAWYDLAIEVAPGDANIVYAGGVNIWKSDNGGNSWDIVAHWVGNGAAAVHADQHDFVFSPHNNALFAAHDGGIHYTENGGESWTEISSGLPISQVYKIGQSATEKDLVINGYQDNGTARYEDGNWETILGGDGMEALVDYDDPNYQYGSIYYGQIYQTTNGGNGFSQIASNGINNLTESGNWVTPYMLDITDPNIFYLGYNNVWRTDDVRSPYDISFEKISDFSTSNKANVMSQSEANPDIFYVAHLNYYGSGGFYRTDDLSADNPAWQELSVPESGNITGLATHPYEANTVYITIGKSVYKSEDKGESWTDISGSLPDAYINTIAFDRYSTEGLYIGTQIGVFFRNDTASAWHAFGHGLPTVDTRELEFYYDLNQYSNSRIRAATYGRGLWESPLHGSSGKAPQAAFQISDTTAFKGQVVHLEDQSILNPQQWFWSVTPETFQFVNNRNAYDANPYVFFTAPGTYSVELMVSNSMGSNSLLREQAITVTDTVRMQSKVIYTCDGKLFDSGADQAYSPDENHTLTVYPTTDNTNINLEFSMLDIEGSANCGKDYLKVYSGIDNSGELLATLCGDSLPGGFVSSHSRGALTLEFVSDGSTQAAGWQAHIGCIQQTMQVNAQTNKTGPCTNEEVILSAEIYGTDAAESVSWQLDEQAQVLDTLNNGDIVVQYLSSGQYNPIVTAVDEITADSSYTVSDTLDIAIEVMPAPVAAFSYTQNTFTVNLTNESADYENISWDFGNGEISSEANPNITYTESDTYTITLTAFSAKCGSDITEQTIEVKNSTSLAPRHANPGPLLSPNPAEKNVWVIQNTENQIKNIKLQTIDGKTLKEKSPFAGQEKVRINLENTPAGVYQVVIRFADGKRASRKLVVK